MFESMFPSLGVMVILQMECTEGFWAAPVPSFLEDLLWRLWDVAFLIWELWIIAEGGNGISSESKEISWSSNYLLGLESCLSWQSLKFPSLRVSWEIWIVVIASKTLIATTT